MNKYIGEKSNQRNGDDGSFQEYYEEMSDVYRNSGFQNDETNLCHVDDLKERHTSYDETCSFNSKVSQHERRDVLICETYQTSRSDFLGSLDAAEIHIPAEGDGYPIEYGCEFCQDQYDGTQLITIGIRSRNMVAYTWRPDLRTVLPVAVSAL